MSGIGLRSENGAGVDVLWRRWAAARPVARTLAVLALGAFALSARAQDAAVATPPQTVPSIEQRVDTFVERLEARRKELGVVGAAVVVAQGDRIVRMRGLGQRSLEAAEPVTEDTVFAIGSVTKQFTAMAVAAAVSDGKLAFEDHPRRYVPSFHLQDPEADAKLNMIDLLAHRSGLDRSDVTWVLAPFTQEEMFELAHRAKPAAKLREQFLYNNTMYALAGAAVAGAQGTTYERLMTERLLRPIGMVSSTLTLVGLTSSRNQALGYAGAAVGASKPVTPVDLASVAPAGALNSTARDMGGWLRFLNSRGRINGEASIAPAVFARLFERHQQVGRGYYGLGFFLHELSGVLVAEHAGNVPGYTAKVVYVPDRGLSFALLTNQDASPLESVAQEIFWDVVVKPELPHSQASPPSRAETGPPTQARPIGTERLVGHYYTSQGSAFDVRAANGGIIAVFSGQPPYVLKATGVNTYDLTGLSGFSVRFVESLALPGRVSAFLSQPPSHPGGNIDFLKADATWLARARAQQQGPDKDLIGSYRNDDGTVIMEIVPYRTGVALIITGQAPSPLRVREPDLYGLEGYPETYQVRVRRSSQGGVAGFTLSQPNLRLDMSVEAGAATADAEQGRRVLERAVTAAGGAEALDRITSMSAVGRAAALTHGLEGRSEDHVSAGRRVEALELGAFGKTVLKSRTVTDGPKSFTVLRDGEQIAATGKALLVARFFAVPHPLYRWRERYVAVAAVGEVPVNGEDAFVIELTPAELAPVRLFISTKSFLILREEIPVYDGNELLPFTQKADYSDYRAVNGLQLPFTAAVPAPIFGNILVTYERIALNEPIDPAIFRP